MKFKTLTISKAAQDFKVTETEMMTILKKANITWIISNDSLYLVPAKDVREAVKQYLTKRNTIILYLFMTGVIVVIGGILSVLKVRGWL